MEQDSRVPQQKRLTDELIKEIDTRIDSPSIRASHVWARLKLAEPELTDWDVLCFCIEFVAMISNRYPWLTSNAKALASIVYHAHYFYPDNLNARTGGKSRHSDTGQYTDTKPETD